MNLSGATANITFEAGDTGFLAPVSVIEFGFAHLQQRGRLAGLFIVVFRRRRRRAGRAGDTGHLLEQVFGTPLTDPDSFAGTNFAAFLANSPFSMTEEASLRLIAGGSITGFNQSMTSGVPEPNTWAMLGRVRVDGFHGFQAPVNRAAGDI